MYWQQEMETLDRPALDALQLERLREQSAAWSECRFIAGNSWNRASSRRQIKSAADVRRLPFTTAADLRENYPDKLLAVSREEALRLHTSSGTTGKPKALFFSRRDLDTAAELIARALCMTGVTRRDVFQNMMSYGLFTGGLVMHYGAEKIGCMVIPAGPGTSERQLLLMQDFRNHGDPRHAQLRVLLCGFSGEKGD